MHALRPKPHSTCDAPPLDAVETPPPLRRSSSRVRPLPPRGREPPPRPGSAPSVPTRAATWDDVDGDALQEEKQRLASFVKEKWDCVLRGS